MSLSMNRTILIRHGILFASAFLLLCAGCLHSPEGLSAESQIDLIDFMNTWEAYEEMYPLFVYKGIDWMEVCDSYYPMAAGCTTEDELIVVITGMLSELQDPAIIIYSTELEDTIQTFPVDYQQNVDMDVLMDNYLELNGFAGYEGGFGWCDPEILPYAYFDSLPTEDDTLAVFALDAFVAQCIELQVPAIVLDIRMNPPGQREMFHNFNHTTMKRFTTKSRVCAWYRVRVGPEYGQYHDFHPPVIPDCPEQFGGTVYLLAGGGCTQAAEDMAANMTHFPNVVIVGESTAGSISEAGQFVSLSMEGNWRVSVVESTVLTYEFDWVEGVGVPPDVYVEATQADFAAGVDPVLEYAIEQLEQY